MLIEKDGERITIQARWQDQWKVIQLPIFPLPAHIDGRSYTSGIDSTSMINLSCLKNGKRSQRSTEPARYSFVITTRCREVRGRTPRYR